MPAARFDHANGSVIFGRNPLRPAGGLDLLQAESQSTGGVRYGYEPHASERPLDLTWRGLGAGDRLALEAFFTGPANGMAELFTYTDGGGVEHSVRFAVAALEFVETAYERYSVTVPLLEVA